MCQNASEATLRIQAPSKMSPKVARRSMSKMSKRLKHPEARTRMHPKETALYGLQDEYTISTGSILEFRQQKSNGKYLPMSVASFERLQEPFRRRKVVSAKFSQTPKRAAKLFRKTELSSPGCKVGFHLEVPSFPLAAWFVHRQKEKHLTVQKCCEILATKG
uniref:Uncharacterized protein n=1 Tax=Vitis vinifera TaxID=29760 RepID=A5ACQ4_VITVI|nr:hypothetical protein VITISV_017094 [Vitis vinifera]